MAKVSGVKRMYDEDVWMYEINNFKHVWVCRICGYRNPDEDECLRHFIAKHPQEWLQAYLLRNQQTEAALRMAVEVIQRALAETQ
jgi:hypothetical protein